MVKDRDLKLTAAEHTIESLKRCLESRNTDLQQALGKIQRLEHKLKVRPKSYDNCSPQLAISLLGSLKQANLDLSKERGED
jgi:hypothetical protein